MQNLNFSALITFKVAGHAGSSHLPIHGAPGTDIAQQITAKLNYLLANFGSHVTLHIATPVFPTESLEATARDTAAVGHAAAYQLFAAFKKFCDQDEERMAVYVADGAGYKLVQSAGV